MTAEERARAATWSIPPVDLNSPEGIRVVTEAIRAAVEEERERICGLLAGFRAEHAAWSHLVNFPQSGRDGVTLTLDDLDDLVASLRREQGT